MYFVGILQVLSFEFQKFGILGILNFHSCKGTMKLENVVFFQICYDIDGIKKLVFK